MTLTRLAIFLFKQEDDDDNNDVDEVRNVSDAKMGQTGRKHWEENLTPYHPKGLNYCAAKTATKRSTSRLRLAGEGPQGRSGPGRPDPEA